MVLQLRQSGPSLLSLPVLVSVDIFYILGLQSWAAVAGYVGTPPAPATPGTEQQSSRSGDECAPPPQIAISSVTVASAVWRGTGEGSDPLREQHGAKRAPTHSAQSLASGPEPAQYRPGSVERSQRTDENEALS